PFPLIGVLPMGTGNAWAHVTGAPKAEKALERIAALNGKRPPLRTFGLVRVNGGTLAPFAGTGFDADLVNDYKAQLQLYPPGPLREAHTGLRGYLGALFTRTIPRHVFGAGPAHVKVTNLGGAAQTLDARGNVVNLEGGETGAVLFEGLAGVAGAATIPEWGYKFRAFPNAEKVPGRLSVRVYSARALEATRHMFKLWGGKDVPNMHDFFVDHVRMEFDRKVPLQFAGDVDGEHEVLEFELAKQRVDVIDWRALQRTN
ncbi:MAG: diacylglycerol/lipid kinase family protein, partial [Myxococcaceae bacterium]